MVKDLPDFVSILYKQNNICQWYSPLLILLIFDQKIKIHYINKANKY